MPLCPIPPAFPVALTNLGLQILLLAHVPRDCLSTAGHELRGRLLRAARLAMVAFLGFVFAAQTTGKGPLAALQLHLADPFSNNWAKNIGNCAIDASASVAGISIPTPCLWCAPAALLLPLHQLQLWRTALLQHGPMLPSDVLPLFCARRTSHSSATDHSHRPCAGRATKWRILCWCHAKRRAALRTLPAF